MLLFNCFQITEERTPRPRLLQWPCVDDALCLKSIVNCEFPCCWIYHPLSSVSATSSRNHARQAFCAALEGSNIQAKQARHVALITTALLSSLLIIYCIRVHDRPSAALAIPKNLERAALGAITNHIPLRNDMTENIFHVFCADEIPDSSEMAHLEVMTVLINMN
jgi:hypothetical protein